MSARPKSSRSPLLPRISRASDSSLFVIAVEGQRTEPEYFRCFERLSSRVHVRILAPNSGRTDPRGVLDRLLAFRDSHEFDPGRTRLFQDDQFWVVVDTDDRSLNVLNELSLEAGRREVRLGVTNPCFEFFLLLHLRDACFETDEIRTRLAAIQGRNAACRLVTELLDEALLDSGGYRKDRPNLSRLFESAADAVRRATAREDLLTDPWPREPFRTQTHRLVRELIQVLEESRQRRLRRLGESRSDV